MGRRRVASRRRRLDGPRVRAGGGLVLHRGRAAGRSRAPPDRSDTRDGGLGPQELPLAGSRLVVPHATEAGEPDAVSESGYTTLHAACAIGDWGLAVRCLERGVSADVCTHYGRTPLHEAARGGQDAVVQALHGRSTNLNPVDSRGQTPLHIAAGGRYQATIRAVLAADQRGLGDHVGLFLTHGADPRAVNHDGASVLHAMVGAQPRAAFDVTASLDDPGVAQDRARQGIVDLLKAGADPRLRDGRGEVPLDRARPWARDTLTAWLKQA